MINRRNFLKNFGFASAAVTVGGSVAQAAAPDKPIRADVTNIVLKGRVHNNGKGIADVAVTDGINVTTTNSKGSYELVSNRLSEFVYISVPAGYVIPNEKGIAKFYQVLNKIGTSTADFNLEKLTIDDTNHNFVVWADPQMISEKDAVLLKTQSAPDLKQLIGTYAPGTLFHGIGCGDLVWDHFELYDDYKEAISMVNIPFYNVIGNHDMDLDARSDEFSSKTFRKHFGPTYYSFNRGQVHYVVLDDVFFIGTAKKYIGYLTETQLQWLEQDLALVKPGSTVVVSLHIPSNTGNTRRNKLKEDDLGAGLNNRAQLYKILNPFNAHIMSGHTHMNEKWQEGNIMEHVHGTVCGAWWTGPICSEGTPNGYGVYEVKGNKLQWFFKSTGKSKDHQLRIYTKGRHKDYPDEITANVWNWDAAWKVEWFEDGTPKGAMQQRVSLDPWAVELYAGAELPAKHKFVEPSLTDHLFYAKPSASAKEIVVKATDRFGNTYTETIRMS